MTNIKRDKLPKSEEQCIPYVIGVLHCNNKERSLYPKLIQSISVRTNSVADVPLNLN